MRGNTTHWVVVGAGFLAVVTWGTLAAVGTGPTGDASAAAPGGEPGPARSSSSFSEGVRAAPAAPPRSAGVPVAVALGAEARPEPPRAPGAAPVGHAPGAVAAGAEAGPDRALVRRALAQAFAEHFPDAVPSEARLDRLTDTVLELRAHREALRRLPVTAGTAERRRRLQEAVAQSVARFEETAEVPLDRFSDTAEPDSGLTRQEDEDDVELRLLQP